MVEAKKVGTSRMIGKTFFEAWHSGNSTHIKNKIYENTQKYL